MRKKICGKYFSFYNFGKESLEIALKYEKVNAEIPFDKCAK